MFSRRKFLAALSAIPFVGSLFRERKTDVIASTRVTGWLEVTPLTHIGPVADQPTVRAFCIKRRS